MNAQWQQQHYGQYEGDLTDVYFLNKFYGWAISSGTSYGILKTTDGGESWEGISGAAMFLKDCIWFTDESSGWAGGKYTKAYYSTNGGLNWTMSDLSTGPNQCIQFVDEMNGWYSGFDFMKTTDGGVTWTSIQPGGFRFFFIDESFGYMPITGVVGPQKILKTHTGGNLWYNVLQDTTPCEPVKIFHVDEDNGWIIGEGTENQGGFILRTTDSWSDFTVQLANYNHNFNDLWFIDSLHGWIVADSGCILYTSDGGLNWGQQPSGTSVALNSIYFPDNEHGWIVGDEATILYTDNAGVGINDNVISTSNIDIYPNPSLASVWISFYLEKPSKARVRIIDIRGNVIYESRDKFFVKGANKAQIETRSLSKGVYVLQVNSKNGSKSIKFIKQ